MDKSFTSYSIEDRSYVAFVKREIHDLVLQANFSRSRVGEIDIIVAELCSNIIKHAGRGEFLFRLMVTPDEGATLELVVIDNGPGMTDVNRMMKDGVSTSNTLGHGLGAISRLSNFFQIYSLPKWGTICYAVVTTGERKIKTISGGLDIRSLIVPKPTETLCGDGFMVRKVGKLTMVLFADGLGHGEQAWKAVEQTKAFFSQCMEVEPVNILKSVHVAIRKTRGVVATVGVLDTVERRWKICGIGNIITRLYDGMMFKHYMSYNGIVGLNIPNSMKETVVEAEKNQTLVMCSDGLRSRWDLNRYPSISKYDNMLLAAALYKDYNRRNDDSSILVGKVLFDK